MVSRNNVQQKRPYLFFIFTGLFLLSLAALWQNRARAETITSTPRTSSSTQPAYGVNFISSAEHHADEQQYQNGLSTGAGWNRWPLYWFNIEQSQDNFNWSTQDTAVIGDITHGLQINAILLGTPSFYTTSLAQQQPTNSRPSPLTINAPQAATPSGLYDAIFNDGSDTPGAGKTINPNNKWANFVSLAVQRYMPDGVLAQSQGWLAGEGITHWEIWNEPDYRFFWDGTMADYGRLLKVAYLVIQQTDPNAQVMFGGLSNINNSSVANFNFFSDVMTLYDADGEAATYNYYHDIVATHNYFYSWQSWYYVWRVGNTLADRGLDKPIWLNETGVAAWDDYPGPVWDSQSGYRATISEQADFVIQTAFYSVFAGADAIFHFQLYDGCGNQPADTDFPPHSGDMCDENGNVPGTNFPCAGDANGLFRNPTDAVCFTQHPQPETARPNFAAYKTLTDYFTDVEPLWRLRPGSNDPANGPQEWIAFYQPTSSSRILGMWSRFGVAQTAVVSSTNQSGSGLLIGPDGITQTLTAQNGHFTIQLPAASNQNAPWDPNLYAIGGRPYILIEQDTLPPLVTVSAPTIAQDIIPISWSGQDDGSGVQNYDVWVSADGGANQMWLTATVELSATFQAELERQYTFTVYARDRAGNVSGGTAVTVQTLDLPEKAYLPFVQR
ncbi:MAG: hypothetical protein GY796_33955 [Chloroflexi bacterium]|nr:hypothetical protein [Chloroflexota bacterium]